MSIGMLRLLMIATIFMVISSNYAQEGVSVAVPDDNLRESLESGVDDAHQESEKKGIPRRTPEVKEAIRSIPELWSDENQFEGRNIPLSSYYDYMFKLKYFLRFYQHSITKAEIIEYAKIAHEYKFTERELEHAVFEAHEKVKNAKKDKISKEEMDLVFRGYKNLKISQAHHAEIERDSPEAKARYLGEKTKQGFGLATQVAEVYDAVTNPDSETIGKVVNTAIILQDKIIWAGSRVKNVLWAEKEPMDERTRDLLEKMPKTYCHLEPHLAGDQPQEICELVDNFTDKNFTGPKNNALLLYGPPGTGKTEIAKSIASMLSAKGVKATFIHRKGSSLMNSYQASGSTAVKKLFEEVEDIVQDDDATVVLFIDEIDAIGGNRQDSNNQDVRATLNELLASLSDYQGNNRFVAILASNLNEILDPALKSRVEAVHVDLPDKKKLKEIFRFHLEKYDEDYSRKNSKREQTLKEYAKQANKGKLSGRDVYVIVNKSLYISRKKMLDGVPKGVVFDVIKKRVDQKRKDEAKQRK